MKKRHLVLCLLILSASVGLTQPVLISQFDKSRCYESTQHYDVESPPLQYKIPIALTNPEIQKWVIWKKEAGKFTRLDQGFARFFVLIPFQEDGEYTLVVDNNLTPLLIEMKLKDRKLLAATYSHCATHPIGLR